MASRTDTKFSKDLRELWGLQQLRPGDIMEVGPVHCNIPIWTILCKSLPSDTDIDLYETHWVAAKMMRISFINMGVGSLGWQQNTVLSKLLSALVSVENTRDNNFKMIITLFWMEIELVVG